MTSIRRRKKQLKRRLRLTKAELARELPLPGTLERCMRCLMLQDLGNRLLEQLEDLKKYSRHKPRKP